METMKQHWTNRTGFIMAAAGSAVGLGNVWKLPYVVGHHGGGLFIAFYLISVVLFALPALVAEILVGRATGAPPIQAFGMLSQRTSWRWVGALGVVAGAIILSFYSVVGGWTIFYSALGAFATLGITLPGGLPAHASAETLSNTFNHFLGNPGLNILFHGIFMLATILVVRKGISGGIERVARVLMTILVGIVLALAIYASTLPGAQEAWNFMWSPKASDFSSEALLEAVGHSFFSLSVGMGAMLTYGSYLGKEHSIAGTSVIVAIFDTLVALLASFTIFAIGFSSHLAPGQGPGLVFITIPLGLHVLPLGSLMTFLFFTLLFCAALTSAISLLEVVVASFVQVTGMNRSAASVWIGLGIFSLGLPSAVSGSTMFFGQGMSKWIGMTWFDLMDKIGSSWLLPLGALGTLVYAGWAVSRKTKEKEILGDGSIPGFYSAWNVLTRFVAPIGIALVFLQLSGLVRLV